MNRPKIDPNTGYAYNFVQNRIMGDALLKKAVEWHGHKCAICGFDPADSWSGFGKKPIYKGLLAHHRHYRTFGNEQQDDVVVLCYVCHTDLHMRQQAGLLTASDIPFVDPNWAHLLRNI